MADEKDLFAPPTENEKAMFAPPTDEEKALFSAPTEQELKTPEGPSAAEALARGTRQGASLGFADEGAGIANASFDAIQSAMNKLGLASQSPTQVAEFLKKQGVKGDIGPTSELESYRGARDEARVKEKAAQEAHPGMYLAGELGGGLLTPGLGALGAAGKTVKGASLAQKMLAGAKAGTAIGGVAGLGSSNADLTKGELANTMSDVGAGAFGGGVFGGAMPVLGAAIGKGANALGATKFAQDLAEHFKLGQKGIPTSGERAGEIAERRVIRSAKNIQNSIFDKLDENFQQKLKLFKDRPNETVNFSDLYKDTLAKIDESLKNSELTADQANDLKASLQSKFYDQLPETVTNGSSSKVTNVIDPATGEVVSTRTTVAKKNLPEEFQPAETRTSAGASKLVDAEGAPLSMNMTEKQVTDYAKQGVMKGDMTLEEAANFVRGWQKSASTLSANEPAKSNIIKGAAAKASDLLEQQVPETAPLNTQSTKAYDTLESLGIKPSDKGDVQEGAASFVKGLETPMAPEKRIAEKRTFGALKGTLGEEPAAAIEEKARGAAQQFRLTKEASRQGQNWLTRTVGAPDQWAAHLANYTGQATRSLGKSPTIKAVSDVAGALNKAILNSPKELLEPLAKTFEQKGNKDLADKLRMASGAFDDQKRNAILFSIAQNPDYRDAFKSISGMPSTEESK